MGTFKLEISTDNAAFAELPKVEIARILRRTADKLEDVDYSGPGILYDVNGNRVGSFSLDDSE